VAEPAYLLDSNICIYILRDAESVAASRLGTCKPGAAVASAVAYAEVVRGIPRTEGAALAIVDAFFRLVPVLPFDEAAARAYASTPFRRGTFDRLIAAHALALDLAVVTNNERDYSDVPGLRIENWTES
jgi:tRNA(fMet)-specific endonuclease VapC